MCSSKDLIKVCDIFRPIWTYWGSVGTNWGSIEANWGSVEMTSGPIGTISGSVQSMLGPLGPCRDLLGLQWCLFGLTVRPKRLDRSSVLRNHESVSEWRGALLEMLAHLKTLWPLSVDRGMEWGPPKEIEIWTNRKTDKQVELVWLGLPGSQSSLSQNCIQCHGHRSSLYISGGTIIVNFSTIFIRNHWLSRLPPFMDVWSWTQLKYKDLISLSSSSLHNHNDHHHHPPHHPDHDKDFTSLEEQSWSSRQSAHRDPSLHRFLPPSASFQNIWQNIQSGRILLKTFHRTSFDLRIPTSNVAEGVGYPVAFPREGVRPLPATSGKDEEEVGSTSLARSSSEPSTVSVRPALLYHWNIGYLSIYL